MNRIVLLIAFVCVIPAMAIAQEKTERFASPSQLSQLRVSFKDGTQRVERGFLQDSMVVLRGKRISMSDVVMVEQSHITTDPLTQGILIGAAFGIAAAYAAPVYSTHIDTQEPTTLLRVVFSAIGGALVGLTIDGMVGNEKDWRTIWPDSP
jgi:hypothetical protein